MSRTLLPWTLSVCAVFAGASVMVAGPDVQDRPGFPTWPAKVWIENRGASEAVPVVIQNAAPEAALHVQVTGTPSVTIAGANALDVRRLRQPWEYLTISVGPGENPVGRMQSLGAEGWEATGLQFPIDGTTSKAVLFKRPR
jgi:hypothetical protein